MSMIFWTGLVLAAGYGVMTLRPRGPFRTIIKVAATAALALWAALNGAPHLIVAALAFSTVGDACLAGDQKRWLLPGMGAFGAAHLAYAVAFWSVGAWPEMTLGAIVLAIGALITGGGFLSWVASRAGDLRWPVMGYGVLILAMAAAACRLPPAYQLATWGALAFVLSDMILSLELFVFQASSRLRYLTSPLLWALYWGGQAAIAAAFLPASALVSS